MLYVRNLTQDVTEEKLKETFEAHGPIQRVKKIKDYAFVHFEERDDAVRAMQELDGHVLTGTANAMQVSLAKPPSDRKKKEEVRLNAPRFFYSPTFCFQGWAKVLFGTFSPSKNYDICVDLVETN